MSKVLVVAEHDGTSIVAPSIPLAQETHFAVLGFSDVPSCSATTSTFDIIVILYHSML